MTTANMTANCLCTIKYHDSMHSIHKALSVCLCSRPLCKCHAIVELFNESVLCLSLYSFAVLLDSAVLLEKAGNYHLMKLSLAVILQKEIEPGEPEGLGPQSVQPFLLKTFLNIMNLIPFNGLQIL